MFNKKPFLTCCFDRFKRRRSMRVISLLLIESMLFSSIAFAGEGNLLKADSLAIPRNIGSVKERFQAEKRRNLGYPHSGYSHKLFRSEIPC